MIKEKGHPFHTPLDPWEAEPGVDHLLRRLALVNV